MSASLLPLLLELKPLLKDPQANFPRIVELLEGNRELAEYEVARFYASRAMVPILLRAAQSPDPRERRQAAEGVRLLCTRTAAAKILRPLVKDADQGTRARARHAVHRLGIQDVALPDARVRPPRHPHPGAIGLWNPSGWSFGIFPQITARARKQGVRKPPRAVQLMQKQLPPLHEVSELRKLLGIKTQAEMRRLLRPGTGSGAPYVEFTIPKASGEPRQIAAPRARLKRVQRTILREILARLVPHPACHGFVPRRSPVSNARPHEGAALVIKLDLKDFFPSLHYRRVLGLFTQLGYGEEVAAALAGLTTHRPVLPDGTVVWPGVLPQGAPTSPALANLACRRLDARLAGLAEQAGAAYTRYADDLTFSFAEEPRQGAGRLLWWVDQICQQEGFTENTGKRRLLRRSNQQRVTGVVVNTGLSVPREARRRFRAILANCRKHGVASQARGRKDFRAYLLGFAAYVKMVQPALGQRLVREVREVLLAEKDRP